ncbi:MAG: hypothetical protein LIO44_05830, partial [Eubacterium sp.]|nr:hypothetical protein [Eubacterium sp.]
MFSVIKRFKYKNIYSKIHYLADYRSDISNLPTNSARGTQGNSSETANNLCMAGSRCKVCEDGSLWLLNNQNEWV